MDVNKLYNKRTLDSKIAIWQSRWSIDCTLATRPRKFDGAVCLPWMDSYDVQREERGSIASLVYLRGRAITDRIRFFREDVKENWLENLFVYGVVCGDIKRGMCGDSFRASMLTWTTSEKCFCVLYNVLLYHDEKKTNVRDRWGKLKTRVYDVELLTHLLRKLLFNCGKMVAHAKRSLSTHSRVFFFFLLYICINITSTQTIPEVTPV